jgi:hypothetical protein
MGRKYVYDFTTATDTIGQYAGIDISGSSAAEKVLWPHHNVSTLPGSPVVGMIYVLDTATTYNPEGEYVNDGVGWKCLNQDSSIALPDWTGAVTQELIPGVSYTVDVTANVTALNLTLTTRGISSVIISNAGGAYTIIDPSGAEKRGSNGLDGLSETASVEFVISREGASYTVSAIERV